MFDFVKKKSFRNWLYPVCIAVIAILVSYGIIGSEDAALWGALVASVLGLGTASVNVVDEDLVEEQKVRNKTKGLVEEDDDFYDDFDDDENLEDFVSDRGFILMGKEADRDRLIGDFTD